MDSLPTRIKENLRKLIGVDLELKNLKFLLAVSGGMDSMVMTHSFLSLGLEIGIAHFNFQLRGKAADLDEELVRVFSRENNIPFHYREEDAKKAADELNVGIQEAARKLRYEFFHDLVNLKQYDFICTAHHGNDQLETFFINLFRGSGLKGLTGIPARRDQIVRPMLWISHKTIQRYAFQHKINYLEDETNKSDKYLRNRIRHRIIAPLTQNNYEYLKKSLNTIHLLTEYQTYIDSQLNMFNNTQINDYGEGISQILDIDDLIQDTSKSFLLKLYLLEQKLYPDSIRDFIGSAGKWKTGKQYEGDSITAWYDRNSLWLVQDIFYEDWDLSNRIEVRPHSNQTLPGGDQIKWLTHSPESIEDEEWVIPLLSQRISFPLILRHRKPGDYIEVGNSTYYRKTLKKLLNEYKIPRPFKDRIYIIEDSKNRIISIPGLMNSPKYCLGKNPDIFLKFTSRLCYLYE